MKKGLFILRDNSSMIFVFIVNSFLPTCMVPSMGTSSAISLSSSTVSTTTPLRLLPTDIRRLSRNIAVVDDDADEGAGDETVATRVLLTEPKIVAATVILYYTHKRLVRTIFLNKELRK